MAKLIKKELFRPFLTKIGYYPIKVRWRKWHDARQIRKRDAKRIAEMTREILSIDHRILPLSKENPNVIVSLTSYGKRVTENAAFAILSILHQSILPNRIVLNLDETKWNDDNLPDLIKKLKVAGLEVNFCEDVGPHTKLLPTLQKYPDDIVVTVDDDILYEPSMLADLLKGFMQTDRRTVICRHAKIIEKTKDGYISYTESKDAVQGTLMCGYIPSGYKGVLYPPRIFSHEIFNKQVFRSFCKNADDLWFGIMEYREHIPVYCIKSSQMYLDFVNTIEQWEPASDTCLYYANSIMGKNNIQYQAVIDYYEL